MGGWGGELGNGTDLLEPRNEFDVVGRGLRDDGEVSLEFESSSPRRN